MNKKLEESLEKKTGESIRSLRETPIDVRRDKYEKRTGKRLQFSLEWPKIGRGNVVRNRPSKEEVDARHKKAIGR